MLKTLLWIGLGSMLGGVLRHLITIMFSQKTPNGFPASTMVINIIGCFCIGLVMGWAEKNSIHPELRLFLSAGVLSGFTTYSAFSFQTMHLIRSGHVWQVFFYVAGTFILGLGLTFAGYLMTSK